MFRTTVTGACFIHWSFVLTNKIRCLTQDRKLLASMAYISVNSFS